jgi:hypothetical protein
MTEPKKITAARQLIEKYELQKNAIPAPCPHQVMLEALQATVLPCPFCGKPALLQASGKKGRMRWEVKCVYTHCVRPDLNDWGSDEIATRFDLLESSAKRLIAVWNVRPQPKQEQQSVP